jgi:hypothetical protein
MEYIRFQISRLQGFLPQFGEVDPASTRNSKAGVLCLIGTLAGGNGQGLLAEAGILITINRIGPRHLRPIADWRKRKREFQTQM